MINTSISFDKSSFSPASDRMLFCIKTKGPIATATLAKSLDMTAEAARQQVQKLLNAGLIEGQQETIGGVGRPRQNWVLTAAGNSHFPDTHAQLSAQLIASVRQIFGEAGLEKLIALRENETRTAYLKTCDGSTVAQRLAQLAAVRSEEGYMARLEVQESDWLLIEDHCPICIAAASCQGFCRSELQLFQEVAGATAQVTREQHLLSGARRCVYRIVPVV